MNNRTLYSIMFGYILGGLYVLLIATVITGTVVHTGKTALKDCEKSLPRDQYCILTAIPKEK